MKGSDEISRGSEHARVSQQAGPGAGAPPANPAGPARRRRATTLTLVVSQARRLAPDVTELFRALPQLCDGARFECDLGTTSAPDRCVCVARFEGPLRATASRRVGFWAWLHGATARWGPARASAALGDCERVVRGIPPASLAGAAWRLLSRVPGDAPSRAHSRPLLRIGLVTPAPTATGAEARALFVAAPRIPPRGDRIAVEVTSPGAAPWQATGLVRGVRRSARPRGATRGFLLELVEPPELPAGATVPPERVRRGAGDGLLGTAFPVAIPVRVGRAPAGRHAGAPAAKGSGSRPGAEHPAPALTVHRGGAPRRRALIVDDDRLSRRLIGDALAERGFDVFSAADGDEGFEALVELLLRLDLLVLDIVMPGMNGEQLLRLIRGPGGEHDLTVVVVSGGVEPATRDRLLAAGANAVISKATRVADIAERAVSAVLGHQRARLGAAS